MRLGDSPQLLRCCATIALSLGGAVSCHTDKNKAVWWRGEQERTELSHKIQLREFHLEKDFSAAFNELEKLKAQSSEGDEVVFKLSQHLQLLRIQVQEMEEQWTGFRQATLRAQRQRVLGRDFREFKTASGKAYQEVRIASIDDAGVTIRHSAGAARLAYGDLDVDQRQLFGLEADLAAAAQAGEANSAAEYDRWVDLQMAANRTAETQREQAAQRESAQATREWSAMVARQTATARDRALARPATSVSSRAWANSTPRYRSSNRTVYYYAPDYCPPRYEPVCRQGVSLATGRVVYRNYTVPATGIQTTSFANTTLTFTP
jgi:hypothetical protein